VMTDFNVIDMTWTKYGLLKVVRSGNGYEWKVFGQHNFDNPILSGKSGNYFDAWKKGEDALYKDLNQIFWILNEMSQKERREGEPADAEIIEQVIREINAGNKNAAILKLNKIIDKENREREPIDVRNLMLARTLLLSEPIGKDVVHKEFKCPQCGDEFTAKAEYESHLKDCL
jgi:hypothetical protein